MMYMDGNDLYRAQGSGQIRRKSRLPRKKGLLWRLLAGLRLLLELLLWVSTSVASCVRVINSITARSTTFSRMPEIVSAQQITAPEFNPSPTDSDRRQAIPDFGQLVERSNRLRYRGSADAVQLRAMAQLLVEIRTKTAEYFPMPVIRIPSESPRLRSLLRAVRDTTTLGPILRHCLQRVGYATVRKGKSSRFKRSPALYTATIPAIESFCTSGVGSCGAGAAESCENKEEILPGTTPQNRATGGARPREG